MAVVHCQKCGRELWFNPDRRKRRDFSGLRCLCGLWFVARESGRINRAHKPRTGATVVDADPAYRRKLVNKARARKAAAIYHQLKRRSA